MEKSVQDKPSRIGPTNPEQVKKAVGVGQSIIADGKPKVEAVRAMYPMIKDEPREVIWDAFIKGAGLTEKGAVTYHYNMKRETKKKGTKKD